MDKPKVDVGINSISKAISNTLPHATPESSVNPMQVIMSIMALIWVIGIACLLIYAAISYFKIAKRISTATHVTDNIFETDMIDTPFIFGLVNTKIYIPTNISIKKLDYILLHEKTHIKRYDHIVKSLSYLVLILHWFNPLVWISFILMTKDMEMSCDESVIEQKGKETKANYATYLLSFAIDDKKIGNVIPLAFGENNLKTRIKNIMNYKKRGFWITIACVIVVLITGIVFISNPRIIAAPKSSKETLYSYMTPYVGDSSKVSNIVRNLDNLEGLVYDGIELHTQQEPYGITVNYKFEYDKTTSILIAIEDDALYNFFYRNSIIMFSLIGNVDYIEFNTYDDNNIQTFTRDMADEYMGQDVRILAKNFDAFKQFFDTLAVDIALENPMKGLELYVWKNSELTGNDDTYYTLLTGTNINKTDNQIYDLDVATNDINEINAMLSKYKRETYLSIQQMNEVDFTKQEMEEIANKIHMPTDNYLMSIGVLVRDDNDTVTIGETEISDIVEENLEIICSSPATSSATGDYIKEHKDEYDKIVSMGIPSLNYLAPILEKDDYGLRGNIAYLLCEDIYSLMTSEMVSLSDEDKVVLFDARKILDDWAKDMSYTTKDYEETKEKS